MSFGARSDNPLLNSYDLFPFADLCPHHFVPAAAQMFSEIDQLVSGLESDLSEPTWENTVSVMEEGYRRIESVWHPACTLFSNKNTPKVSRAFIQGQKLVDRAHMRFYQSRGLYRRLGKLKKSDVYLGGSVEQRRCLDRLIKKSELSGVQLEGQDRERFSELKSRIDDLGVQFAQNLMSRARDYKVVVTEREKLLGLSDASLAVLSENFKKAMARCEENNKGHSSGSGEGPWLIGLDVHSAGIILGEAEDPELRKKIFEDQMQVGVHRDHDNIPVTAEILRLRHELALLLGYEHYAQLTLATRMCRDLADVFKLYDQIREGCMNTYHDHIDRLLSLRESRGLGRDIHDWDEDYWTGQYFRESCGVDPAQIRDYLPLSGVMAGINELMKRLFDVELRPFDPGPRFLWDDHVKAYEIYDIAHDQSRARVLVDVFARPGEKKAGAWMSAMRDFCVDRHGITHRPVAYVTCNFSPPTAGQEALLGIEDVLILFHEFGHVLQQSLSDTPHLFLSGTAGVVRDVVELPSTFMEYWVYDQDTFMGLARHYRTGEQVPEELFSAALKARTYRVVKRFFTHIELGTVDLKLHSAGNLTLKPCELYGEVIGQCQQSSGPTSGTPPCLIRAQKIYGFAHIFSWDYAAGYYSYLWAEVMAADAFACFLEAMDSSRGELSKVAELGRRFRDTILARCGGDDPRSLYRSFARRDASPVSLITLAGATRGKAAPS